MKCEWTRARRRSCCLCVLLLHSALTRSPKKARATIAVAKRAPTTSISTFTLGIAVSSRDHAAQTAYECVGAGVGCGDAQSVPARQDDAAQSEPVHLVLFVAQARRLSLDQRPPATPPPSVDAAGRPGRVGRHGRSGHTARSVAAGESQSQPAQQRHGHQYLNELSGSSPFESNAPTRSQGPRCARHMRRSTPIAGARQTASERRYRSSGKDVADLCTRASPDDRKRTVRSVAALFNADACVDLPWI
ncbi:hypothetical protein L1887_49498 [Cichorium endivia]|nr:hypothetical protein L1887_49498 [Cichorium endivia]